MPLHIGKLDRRLQLDSFTETRSAASGEVRTTWQPLGTVWGSVRYETGTENFEDGQKQAVQRVVFRIRYRTGGLSTRFRVTFQGREHEILAVAEIGRREAMDLTAENRT